MYAQFLLFAEDECYISVFQEDNQLLYKHVVYVIFLDTYLATHEIISSVIPVHVVSLYHFTGGIFKLMSRQRARNPWGI